VRVSIVTVCLNAERYIEQTLHSILSQCYSDIECIVVDGGSSDNTIEIIADIARRDSRIHWNSEEDSGISDAMNRGMNRSSGDIVAYLHADDCYRSTAVIAKVVDRFHRYPKANWVTGGICEVDEQGHCFREILPRRFTSTRLLRNNIIFHPATFVRREAMELVGGFNPTLRYAMDYDLWLRLAIKGPPVALDEIIANFRVHPGSLSSANRRAVLEEEYEIRRRYLHHPVSRVLHALYHRWRSVGISDGY